MAKFKDFHFLSLLLKSLLLLYILMAAMRLILYLYNYNSFAGIGGGELAYIFFAALRFDTVSILYVNSLFILWHLWPTVWRASAWHARIGRWLYVAANTAMITVELGDVAYYPYAFRRVTRSDLEMQQDFFAMLPAFLKEFWWMLLIVIITAILLWRAYNRFRAQVWTGEVSRFWRLKQGGLLLVAAGFAVVGMRGGLQPRPLTGLNAIEYVENISYAALPCNATLNLIHSAQQRTLLPVAYFDSAQLAQYQPITRYNPDGRAQKKYNIVLIIVESFGKEYISHFNKDLPIHTPYIDSLCARGLLFTQAQANGTRSTQGVVAITSGLPALMQDPFMFSAFAQNKLGALPNYLSKIGYKSAFFHGGQNGTMNFDAYAKTIGYTEYHGKNEYDKAFPDSAKVNFDGDWGVYDWPFFRYTVEKISALDTPFFASYFTIAPHHPFHVPADFAAAYADEKPMYRAIRYADESLRVFFEAAEKQPWYDNTLFIITADHIGAAISPAAAMRPLRYQIPIVFFHPTDTNFQRRQSPQLAQQIDILPTTLRFLGYPFAFDAFGRDLLQPQIFENFSYTYDNGLYQIMDTAFALLFDGERAIALFDYRRDTFLMDNYLEQYPDKVKYLENQLKARIQAHHHGYLHNLLPQ